jgi:hypothetical protein
MVHGRLLAAMGLTMMSVELSALPRFATNAAHCSSG